MMLLSHDFLLLYCLAQRVPYCCLGSMGESKILSVKNTGNLGHPCGSVVMKPRFLSRPSSKDGMLIGCIPPSKAIEIVSTIGSVLGNQFNGSEPFGISNTRDIWGFLCCGYLFCSEGPYISAAYWSWWIVPLSYMIHEFCGSSKWGELFCARLELSLCFDLCLALSWTTPEVTLL